MERALLVNAWLHLFCIVMKNFLWVLMMSVPSAHRVFFCQHNKEPNVKSSHTFRIWQPWRLGGLHCVIWVQLWAVDCCRNLDRSVRGKKKERYPTWVGFCRFKWQLHQDTADSFISFVKDGTVFIGTELSFYTNTCNGHVTSLVIITELICLLRSIIVLGYLQSTGYNLYNAWHYSLFSFFFPLDLLIFFHTLVLNTFW